MNDSKRTLIERILPVEEISEEAKKEKTEEHLLLNSITGGRGNL